MSATLSAAVAALMLFSGAAPAVAHAPVTEVERVELRLAGFDRDVAEGNGFAIVAGSDGRESSVPVTAGARALAAETVPPPSGGEVPACGLAWLEFSRSGARGEQLEIRTGYVMPLAVASRHWRVAGAAGARPFEVTFDTARAGEAEWSDSATRVVEGGGSGAIMIDSHIVLANGATCWVGTRQHRF
jgi:hypothetical protein